MRLFAERRITVVVNFWPKLDPDLADTGLRAYWYLPTPHSRDMLSPLVVASALMLADHLRNHTDEAALILCEAGKTRSVCFAALTAKALLSISRPEALALVTRAVPSHALKPFMVDFFATETPGPSIDKGFYLALNQLDVGVAMQLQRKLGVA